MEGVAQSKKLGILDQSGIDAFVIKSDGDAPQLVVQCKGFEVFEYGRSQHTQCLAEIKKFALSGPITPEYWLVINRPIIDRAMRDEILAGLNGLVVDGRALKVELLDGAHMHARLEELAKAQLMRWGDAKRSELFAYYAERLEFVDYIPDVPFNRSHAKPAEYIDRALSDFIKSLPAHKTGKYRRAPAFIVTSSFGFGKTSTLHAVAKNWVETSRFVIYAPAALLDGSAFHTTAGLAEAILEFLIPDDAEITDLVHDFLRDVLRATLGISKNWLLLIDGLDESPWAFDSNSIASFWLSLVNLGVPTVISARDELVENRKAEFFPDKKFKVAPTLRRVSLDDWSDSLILQFVKLFARRRGGKEPEGFQRFRKLIEDGEYNSVYGDIPKRPLFLGMLAEDAWSDHEPERQVHRLYGKYFRLKLGYDRTSLAAAGISKRPSKIVEALGLEEATERILHTMQDAAVSMHDRAEEEFASLGSRYLDDIISETNLRTIADRNRLPVAQVEDVLLHSLLQPAGRDPATRERQARFAHRSFRDWFLARAYVEGRKEGRQLPDAARRFFERMSSDVEAGGALP